MKITLSNNQEVTLKEALTWGDAQKIQATMMSSAKMSGKANKTDDLGIDFDTSGLLEAKYVAMECAVLEIKDGENIKKFSRDWVNGLSVKDGNTIHEAVDELSKK
jgi:hypothetical protein